MADRVAVMIDGTVLQIGTPQEIYDDPDRVEVARFVGNPRINLLPGRIAANGTPVLTASSSDDEPGGVTLGIRPEALGLRLCGPESADAAVRDWSSSAPKCWSSSVPLGAATASLPRCRPVRPPDCGQGGR